MSMAAAEAARAVDELFRLNGESAVYTPAAGGGGVPCTVIPFLPDVDNPRFTSVGYALAPAKQPAAMMVEVRRAEIALPEQGGTLLLDGLTYPVLAGAKLTNSSRLVWLLPLGPGA